MTPISKNQERRDAKVALRRVADRLRPILAERFPKAFSAPKEPKLPLKVGIYFDLVAGCPDISPDDVKIFLQHYTRGPRYFYATLQKGYRIDLNGEIVDAITPSQAAYALTQLRSFKKLPPQFAVETLIGAAP